MSTLMLIYATCPICYELQQTDHLTFDDERGLICADRPACLRRKAIRLALLPPRREGAEGPTKETA